MIDEHGNNVRTVCLWSTSMLYVGPDRYRTTPNPNPNHNPLGGGEGGRGNRKTLQRAWSVAGLCNHRYRAPCYHSLECSVSPGNEYYR